MRRMALCSIATLIFLLGFIYAGIASTGDPMADLWQSESFVKKAQAIKEGDWEDVKPQDVAIAGLYEMGRAVNRLEGRLESEMARLYRFALIGALVLAAYLVLQLVLTFALILRLGRKLV